MDDHFSRRRFIIRAMAPVVVLSATGRGRFSAASATTMTPSIARGPRAVPMTFSINGRTYAAELEPRTTLLDALRDRLGLTGTKKGCDSGTCGACTVLVDGKRINACLRLAVMSQHAAITTIEGLATGDALHPVQAAFLEHDAFQCGYCTPGQIMSAVGFLSERRATDDASVREWMSGNICRCGAYANIAAAVRAVAERRA